MGAVRCSSNFIPEVITLATHFRLRLRMYLSAVLACLLAFGTAWTPQPVVHAAGYYDLQDLVITDQDGEEPVLFYNLAPKDFDPDIYTYTLYYYHDTLTYTINAVAQNPDYDVIILKGSDAVARETGAANYTFNARETTVSIYIRVSDGNTYNQYTLNVMLGMRGRGTEEEPFQIASAEQLDMAGRSYGAFTSQKHYELVADIDMGEFLSNPGYNSGKGWNPFTLSGGSLDGNGHTISGLWINDPNGSVGLIGYLTGSHVRNLHLVLDEDRGIVGGSSTAGLVYSVSDSTIENVTVTGSVTGQRIVGGIAAVVSGEDSLIANSKFEGSVEATETSM